MSGTLAHGGGETRGNAKFPVCPWGIGIPVQAVFSFSNGLQRLTIWGRCYLYWTSKLSLLSSLWLCYQNAENSDLWSFSREECTFVGPLQSRCQLRYVEGKILSLERVDYKIKNLLWASAVTGFFSILSGKLFAIIYVDLLESWPTISKIRRNLRAAFSCSRRGSSTLLLLPAFKFRTKINQMVYKKRKKEKIVAVGQGTRISYYYIRNGYPSLFLIRLFLPAFLHHDSLKILNTLTQNGTCTINLEIKLKKIKIYRYSDR